MQQNLVSRLYHILQEKRKIETWFIFIIYYRRCYHCLLAYEVLFVCIFIRKYHEIVQFHGI